MGYDFEVVYKPGKKNGPTNALFRLPEPSLPSIQLVSRPVFGLLKALRALFVEDPNSCDFI